MQYQESGWKKSDKRSSIYRSHYNSECENKTRHNICNIDKQIMLFLIKWNIIMYFKAIYIVTQISYLEESRMLKSTNFLTHNAFGPTIKSCNNRKIQRIET